MKPSRFRASDALAAARAADDGIYGVLLSSGSIEIGYYAPIGTDDQQPHRGDEIYIVRSGHGEFEMNGDRRPFVPGDVMFVPGGTRHRFMDFSDDFEAWVVFVGKDEAGDA